MNDTTDLTIIKLVTGGAGLALKDGKAVFVPFAAPGDRLTVDIEEDKGDWYRASIASILEPGPDRVEPVCPLYGKCGGCSLQHLSYPAQCAAKIGILQEHFKRIAGLDTGPVECVSGAPYWYRNRVQVHLSGDGRLGFAARESDEIIQAKGCSISDPSIHKWLGDRARIGRKSKEVSAATGGMDRFTVYGNHGQVLIEGKDRDGSVEVAGDTIRFPLRGFFQSNLGLISELVRREILPLIHTLDGNPLPGTRAADLYAGVGLFGHFLAAGFETVVCVESESRSLEYARFNVGGKVEFHSRPVEEWTAGKSASARYDLIVADPPRAGMDPKVLAWLGVSTAHTLVYVSCDPATLARDAKVLVGAGWILDSVRLYDFYPQTAHIESVAVFVHTGD